MTVETAAMPFPKWAQEMREIFRSGTVSQFVLHGNLHDLVGYRTREAMKFLGLKEFLSEVLFDPFDTVLYYNRGAGIKALKGKDHFQKFLKLLDEWTQTAYQSGPLPREPQQALDLVDRFLQYSRTRTTVEAGQARIAPLRVAIIIDYVQYLVPEGGASSTSERTADLIIRFREWASDPAIVDSQAITVLLAENLADVSRALVENPYSAKLAVPLPNQEECLQYLQFLRAEFADLEASCEVSLEVMAAKVVGLSRVNLRRMVSLALRNQRKITAEYLTRIKKELIEKECYGLLEFIESRTTLEDVAGHDNARKWLAEDARLIKEGRFASLPMGYLMTGRIGTGKTWLTMCWAGQVGIPFVALKNFRDKWMGATEGNLEKIFVVLKALGQVIVFVDEADQMTGKRGGGDSDSGLGGRIYAMLAKEMSDTRNRGRIIWIFATSRPDMLEVDLKRPGRLDVHIPLFAPQSDAERQALFVAMTRKVKIPVPLDELPSLPPGLDIGGNEMEAMLVRAVRTFELQDPPGSRPFRAILEEVLKDYRPMSHTRSLEYMDLIAVKECTDEQFLPERFAKIPPEELDARIEGLKLELRIP